MSTKSFTESAIRFPRDQAEKYQYSMKTLTPDGEGGVERKQEKVTDKMLDARSEECDKKIAEYEACKLDIKETKVKLAAFIAEQKAERE